ncbi:MAG: FtsX-like permease family protein [Armatimonadota bacterium]
MSPVWRWVSLRHLFQEGGRTLLTLLGVALGVAVFVSIRVANHSAMASFADTVDAVAGKANLQITADTGGFDERIFPKVRKVPGVQAAAPVVQVYAQAEPGRPEVNAVFQKDQEQPFRETLLVLGIDLFSERPFGRYEPPRRGDSIAALEFLADPRAVAVTRHFAERQGLSTGDSLTLVIGGRPEVLTVRQVLENEELQQAMGGNVAVVDIAVAQELFQRYGKLDRIDLLVDPARREEVRAALAPLLPPQAEARLPQGRTRQVENMVEAFALNLTALSFIALFVSMFLIFNAVSMAVVRRRREIGVLRSLGVTRGGIVRLFLGEALFLGVIGSLLGLALGTLLAKGALGAIAKTITTLYLTVHAENLYLSPAVYLSGFGIGVGMALLSALAPALEASRTPPGLTTRQGSLLEAQPLPIGRLTAVGLGMLVLAALTAWWTVGARRPEGGFVSAFLLLMGFSLVSPGFTLLGERVLGPLVGRVAGIEGTLGARSLRDAVARTSVVVAALMVAVGMTVGLTIMVGSFRRTVNIWVDQTLRGDLYVEPAGRQATGGATVLSPEVVRIARELPGVAAVDTYRGLQITYGDRLAQAVGIDFEVQEQHGRLQFLRGDAAEILRRARQEDGVIVSESFSFRHRVEEGDSVTLRTPSGVVRLPVEGVYYDYSTDAGALMMHHPLYRRLWNDPRTESIAIYTRPGLSVDEVREQLVRAVDGRVVLAVTPNLALRRRVMNIFDQTFQITYALQAIAIFVSVLGVISTLTALILQRGREIGVLRAVGSLRRQVRKMVLVESGLLGLLGALLGCACGVALSLLLTYVINKQFFGWSIRLTIEPWVFIQAVLLMVGAALAAGLVPARLAASRVAAEAMRAE